MRPGDQYLEGNNGRHKPSDVAPYRRERLLANIVLADREMRQVHVIEPESASPTGVELSVQLSDSTLGWCRKQQSDVDGEWSRS